jgi:cell division septum initiation protein DivIVA
MLQQYFHKTLADSNITALQVNRLSSEIEAGSIEEESLGVFTAIELLEEKILNSPRVPLTGKTMVNEEELLEQLDLIRLKLPEVIIAAQEILQYKQQITTEAQKQVQHALIEANHRADRITNELGIIELSKHEANQIRQAAIVECEQFRQQTIAELEQMRQEVIAECQQIQSGADEYADQVLHNMQCQFTDVLQTVQRGRKRLERDAIARKNSQPQGQELVDLGDRGREIDDRHPAKGSN